MNKKFQGLLVLGALLVGTVPAFEIATSNNVRVEIGDTKLQFFNVARGTDGSMGAVIFSRGETECYFKPLAPWEATCRN